MFASKAWSGSICLRCQLHLARSALRRSSTIPQRQLHTSQDGLNSEAAEPADEGGRSRNRFPRSPRSKQFLKNKGSRIVMKEEELGTGILGRPAHAIVMKDGGRIPRKQIPVDESLDSSVEHIDLAALIEREGSTPDLEEVLANIAELKPAHSTISSREFKDIKNILIRGFTLAQLATYIQKYEPLNSHEINGSLVDLPTPSHQHGDTYPWIVARSQWVPEVAETGETADPHLKGYLTASMTPKEKLVVRLMRQYWEISIQEVMALEGHMDLSLREPEFSLLTLGSQERIREIARDLLGPGRRIEIIPSESALRIVAPKAIAETVLTELDSTLQKVQSRTFDTGSMSTSFESALLAEVGRLTNSIVTQIEFDDSIRVTWIDVENRSSDLEDLGDRVFRLLLTTAEQRSTTKKLLVYPEKHDSARLVIEHASKESMSWRDRLDKWTRWSAPRAVEGDRAFAQKGIHLSKESAISQDAFSRQMAGVLEGHQTHGETRNAVFTKKFSSPLLPLLNITVHPPKEESPRDEPTHPGRGWSPETVITTAVFGHLLHPQPSQSRQIISKGPITTDTRRILSPAIPPLFELNLPGKIRPNYLDSTILMRFLPTPGQVNEASNQQAPSLELAINVREPHGEEGYISGISYLRAIKNTQITDVCLPDQLVDFRLTQAVTADLLGNAIFNTPGMAPLEEFLSKSRLEPQNGYLETPARLSGLSLPKRLFSAAHNSDSNNGAPVDLPADDGVPADYIFTGLEVRRDLETAFDGWKLVYTSIEAGQGGGQRAELSLEAVPDRDWSLARKAEGISGEAFLESAYSLAKGNLLSWAEASRNDEW